MLVSMYRKCVVAVVVVVLFSLFNSNIILVDESNKIVESAECCVSITSNSIDENMSMEEFLEMQWQNYIDRSIPTYLEVFQEEHKDEIHLLALIITAEAGVVDTEPYCTQAIEAGITPDIWQQYVGYCVMNRVYQKCYPNTIEGVFNQGDAYADTSHESVRNGIITKRCVDNATIVLMNYYNDTVPVPRNMVFQSQFVQGNSIFLHVGNTYFGLRKDLPAE